MREVPAQKHFWLVLFLVGLAVIVGAITIPGSCWDTRWWQQLAQHWSEFADQQGWSVGFGESFILVGMLAGALMVLIALVVAQVNKTIQLKGRLEFRGWSSDRRYAVQDDIPGAECSYLTIRCIAMCR